jgi:hypothetical protein
MPRTIAVFPSSLILISLCFAQRRSRNSARPRAVRRRVHIDNAAAHAMFLIPTGSRAKDEEHEGVNREKMRRNHGSAPGRKSQPRAHPFRACGPRFYQLVAIRRRAYTMML